MTDFEGKRIKIVFNTVSGWITEVGNFIKDEGTFLVFQEDVSKRIKYVNVSYIKFIEILGDVGE